ncbi:MAG: HNH endonuclease [Candidatus Thermoplasmatota archaeon]|nr:HNH endonuclease [Candidatus Thermoplasmatota archaeon]
MNYWIMISKEERWYGGNDGYQDNINNIYIYDSKVQNHKQVMVGDIAFFRNEDYLLGVCKIDNITKYDGIKEIKRCPICEKTEIYPRSNTVYKYKCKMCKEEFEEPLTIPVNVTNFSAHYGNLFFKTPEVPYSEIIRYQISKSRQLAIARFNGVDFCKYLGNTYPALLEIAYKLDIIHRPQDESIPKQNFNEIIRNDISEYIPNFNEIREKILRTISERKGQNSFRESLIKQHNNTCMISQCIESSVLDAAHIIPYQGENDNHINNGLLLRTDIHSLFDLDLLGINPDTLEIFISKKIKDFTYTQLTGKKLRTNGIKLSYEALKYRWALYLTNAL